ncbi:hypothetical protein [Hydrogenoanaerobacterium sp.]|uniref:hypothetical protein n=1 Tax=Hydrogenoanaerobacterium sp. TaxID=2953763 RepID=UPI00289AAD75|nr:hypothetical protein [Hydrogenoanaerobacterium sp.]
MSETIIQNIQFLLITAALLAIIFLLLWLVGRKKNKEFLENKDEILANHKVGVRDIVLLPDGRRVTITDIIDDGASFTAETLVAFGKKPDKLTLTKDDIIKIEYYAS